MSHAAPAVDRLRVADLKGNIDFGIITIREDELEAVLQRFPEKIGIVSGLREYNIRRVMLGSSEHYDVAVVRCVEQGNTEAQAAAHALLDELAPRWLLVVGIAGAAPAMEFTLGDVVVSTRIADFSVEATLRGGEVEHALGGGPIHPQAAKLAANLKALAGELGSWNDDVSIGVPRPDVLVPPTETYGDAEWQATVRRVVEHHFGGRPRAPLVTAGAIASSDRLIKDAELLQVWLRIARQVVAVEMESAGVYRAAYERGVPFLAVRGISDVVGLRRDPAWTSYACHTAGAFTHAFLRTRPIAPRSRRSRRWAYAAPVAAAAVIGLLLTGTLIRKPPPSPSSEHSEHPSAESGAPLLEDAASPPPHASTRTSPIEENSSVRLIYYRLQGRAVDQFLRGRFTTVEGHRVTVIETDTTRDLRTHLKEKGTSPSEWMDGFIRVESGPRPADVGTPKRIGEREQTELTSEHELREAGGKADGDFGPKDYGVIIQEPRLRALLAAHEDWQIRRREDGRVMLWRYADRKDLKELHLPLYHHLTGAGMPKHFLVTTLFGNPGTGACGYGLPRALAFAAPGRNIELETAILENISDKPINLGEFGFREGLRTELRDANGEDEELSQAQPSHRVLYPPRQLKPNEQVGLLLRVALRYPADPGWIATDLLEAKPTSEPGKYLLLQPQPELDVFMHAPFNTRRIDVSLKSVPASEEPDFGNTILYGRTVRLETIEVAHETYAVRDQESKVAFIMADLSGASCPHVYTRDKTSGGWRAEQPILVGYVGRRREAEASVHLSRFDGRVLIREEEDEVTYLDEVHLEVVSGGHRRNVWPVEPLLRFRDNRHLVLRKGDEIDLSFRLEPGETAVAVVAFGYYEPTPQER